MKNPMEHLKQWHNLYAGILTPNETALYIHLFMIANSRFWPDWIELTDSQLSLGTNINIKRIPDTVNSLAQKNLIQSKRGKGKAPSQYNICLFRNYTQTGVINERKTGDKREINERLEENFPCESKDENAPKTKTKTTQHNDKDNNNFMCASAPKKKFVPPTLDEANQYVMEKGLHISAKDFIDYFTEGNWIDKNGCPVRNWKQKMLTWEKFHAKPTSRKTKHEESMDAADRAIAFFEGGTTDEQRSGDNQTFEDVPFGVP